MIIEFNVENFLSFQAPTRLSMVAAKSFKEHKDSHLAKSGSSLDLLKSAIVYGNNASGKSNLLRALGFMKQTVLNSFRDALLDEGQRKFPLEKFALSTQSAQEASLFELTFVHEGTRYRYGFELDYDKVAAEWLFHTTSKEVYLFKRDHQKLEINKSAFKEGLGREEDLKENVLFLSMLATLGKETASKVVAWFKRLNFVNGMHDFGHKLYTIEKLKADMEFSQWVAQFLKFLEIANLSTVEEDGPDLESLRAKQKVEKVLQLLESIHTLQSQQPKRDKIITFHRQFDQNKVLVDTVAFQFDQQESEGTKKLLYLLGPWYDTLRNGKVLVVDELDSRLHSHLTRYLLDFFHLHNSNNAQLICAVHDVSLLNKQTFRRDQIWFVEKDQFGASELYSLAEFKTDKVRNQSAFDKNYMSGNYGAIPNLQFDETLTRNLHGKRQAQQV